MGPDEEEVFHQIWTTFNSTLGFDKPDAPPPPTGHGWTMQNGKCYTKEALPRSLDASLHQERHEIPPDLSDTGEVSNTGEEIDYDSE